MRYQVGEELFTVNFQFEGRDNTWNSRFHVPFLSLPFDAEEKVSGIRFLKLTVKEHHKVPDHWGDADKLVGDGFILTSENGSIFHNQYPRAFYGQISNEADRRFTRAIPEEMDIETYRDILAKDSNFIMSSYLLVSFMTEVYNAIDEMEKFHLECASKFCQLRDMITKQFEQDFPDYQMSTQKEILSIDHPDYKNNVTTITKK